MVKCILFIRFASMWDFKFLNCDMFSKRLLYLIYQTDVYRWLGGHSVLLIMCNPWGMSIEGRWSHPEQQVERVQQTAQTFHRVLTSHPDRSSPEPGSPWQHAQGKHSARSSERFLQRLALIFSGSAVAPCAEAAFRSLVRAPLCLGSARVYPWEAPGKFHNRWFLTFPQPRRDDGVTFPKQSSLS